MFAVICLISVSLVSIATVTQWLEGIWPDLQPQQMVETFQTSGGIGIKVLVVIAAVVIAPLAEETLFRGFVYGVLKRYTDAPFAALASSLMFAIIHLHVGSLLPLCVLAVLFCIAYEITGCLLVPMLLHMIFNATSIVMMLDARSRIVKPASSSHHHAAIDGEHLAGDVAGGRAGEVECGGGDVFGLSRVHRAGSSSKSPPSPDH
jgi:membrane protease YdiL (CAAX protease family)